MAKRRKVSLTPNPSQPEPEAKPIEQEEQPKHEKVEEEQPKPKKQEEEQQPESEEEEEEEEETQEEDTQEEKNNEEEDELDTNPESIKSLLTSFSKDQLINLIISSTESHPKTTIPLINSLAESDPTTRKIFVHGLGWDATSESLTEFFSQYGEIQECKAVQDKATGKSKGYAFILFKNRKGAVEALKEPQKTIGGRVASCQLAAVGPVSQQPVKQVEPPVSEVTMRKIFVSNVGADTDMGKLVEFFGKFGEIEEGPLGIDKATGKPKGFCLFVYKSVESAKKALEEPHKMFEGCMLHCQKAVDGPKGNKQGFGGQKGGFGGGRGGHMMAPAAPMGQAVPGLNPALGQALTTILATQGVGGLTNILASATQGVAPGMQGGYGNGGQWLGSGQGGYQGGRGRGQQGYGQQGYGGVPPYMGHR